MSDMPGADAPSSATPGTSGTSGTSATSGNGEPQASTAGGLLRQARQAQGLHIAALAAAIKVVPRKLELLESDQYSGLPDATFTRALAQAVCRHLKVDAAPVLALLPPPNGHRLEQVSEGLKTTFHERPGRFVPRDWASASSSALWLALLLVVGAVVLYALPAGWLPATRGVLSRVGASAPVGPAASGVVDALKSGDSARAAKTTVDESETPPLGGEANSGASAGSGGANPVLGTPAIGVASPAVDGVAGVAGTAGVAGSGPASAASVNAVGQLKLSSKAQSWVEVLDGNGRSLLGRLIVPGETVALDGPVPLKLRIGNAGVTDVIFNGKRVELAPFTRDNVARLDLK